MCGVGVGEGRGGGEGWTLDELKRRYTIYCSLFIFFKLNFMATTRCNCYDLIKEIKRQGK